MQHDTADKWEKVQSEIAKRWVCLDPQDIEDCRGNLDKLPEKIQRAYEWDFDDALEDYQRFCDFVLRSMDIEACGPAQSADEESDELTRDGAMFNGTIEKNYFPVQNQKI